MPQAAPHLFQRAAEVALGISFNAQSQAPDIPGVSSRAPAGDTKVQGNGPATVKSNTSSFGQSAETSSRIGFKGTEDLGGGTSAFFTAEFGLNPQEQDLSGNTNGGLRNLQTFVGLKKNGLGEASIGTQYTPVFNQLAATDVGQTNNMPGSAIYPQNAVSSGNQGTAGVSPYTGSASAQMSNNSRGLTVRTANTIRAKSDAFAGFSAGASYTQNASSSDPAGSVTETANNYTGWGVQADFTGVKNLYIGAAMQQLKSNNPSPTATLASPAPDTWDGATGGTNTQDNQTYAAATYDFGILKGFLQYVNRKAESTINANYFAKRTAQQVGVRSYITPTIEGWASWGNGKLTQYGLSQPSANFTAWQVGANYYLSKRTNLYGIYGSNNLSSSSASSSVPVNTSAMAVGVRHTF
jgi:predicted porin